VPVVATRVGGVPEVIIPERTGLLVEPGDHEGLAGSIIRILRHPDLGKEMAQQARELVLNKYTVTHMLNKIENLYKSGSGRKS
jgi:glycosyltransferase involved in cell wall biosynthesis